jgi:hypothetical protein
MNGLVVGQTGENQLVCMLEFYFGSIVLKISELIGLKINELKTPSSHKYTLTGNSEQLDLA